MRISEAYAEICSLAFDRGLRNLKECTGLTILRIDEHWTAKINPHESVCDGVRPFEIGLTYNNWPAGMVGPKDGIIASGRAANEDALLAAVKAQRGKTEEPPTGP